MPTLNCRSLFGHAAASFESVRASVGLPRPASVRQMADLLFIPITLDVRVDQTSNTFPLQVGVHVGASPGIVTETNLSMTKSGVPIPEVGESMRAGVAFDRIIGIDQPGLFRITINRRGFTAPGVESTLTKQFDINARERPGPPPPPPGLPPRPELPVRPSIGVSSSGSGQGSVFVIAGSGFSPNHDVRIRVVDDALNERDFHQSTDGLGRLNARLGIPCNSGLGLHFSATDGRPDPSDLTGFLWSNTFNIPCP